MFTVGFVIIFLVMKENSFLSKAVEIQEGHKVITTGPYKIIRHPQSIYIDDCSNRAPASGFYP